ncbi:MAG: hypothetical protein PHD76_11895 [Methylacidiphilales bacterium]|nr:hypothetical protein [Candidatus Methylacidiphilales bacterium]
MNEKTMSRFSKAYLFVVWLLPLLIFIMPFAGLLFASSYYAPLATKPGLILSCFGFLGDAILLLLLHLIWITFTWTKCRKLSAWILYPLRATLCVCCLLLTVMAFSIFYLGPPCLVYVSREN